METEDKCIMDFASILVQEKREECSFIFFDYPKFMETLGQLEERDMIILENGARYEGQWLVNTDIRQGFGKQVWKDGSMYEGYWVDNKANGPKGRLIYADGDVYSGTWKDDKAHGSGTYYYLDGAVYSGGFKEDKQHGNGLMKWPGRSSYRGEYVEGR